MAVFQYLQMSSEDQQRHLESVIKITGTVTTEKNNSRNVQISAEYINSVIHFLLACMRYIKNEKYINKIYNQ